MAEQSGQLLLADKRLAELEANMDTKRKTESYEEMLKQLKSALKEEIAALKSKVRETHSTARVTFAVVCWIPRSQWNIYGFNSSK